MKDMSQETATNTPPPESCPSQSPLRRLGRALRAFAPVVKERFNPAIVTSFVEGYTLSKLTADVIAGIIVAVVALPLAIAFAIASGVSPQAGLVTAVVAGVLISVCGGCRVQIGGPTGAFIVIIYGVVQQFGVEGLIVATLIAGVILVVMGLCGLGSIIKYIPYPVTVGFTAGIALIIFAGQIPALLGLTFADGVKLPGDFVGKVSAYCHATDLNVWAVAISLATILISVFWRKVTQRVPGSIVAIVSTTLFVKFAGVDVATIGSLYPNVAGGMSLPMPHLPIVSLDVIRELFPTAMTIALLAGIESLLSAVVADGMTGKRHNSNTELIGQGIANIVTPLFGGIPATGAIARTATNIKNGGVSPIAGVVHAAVLLLIMLCLGQYAAMIPMATLAGVVAIVAYNMSEWRLVKQMFRSTRSDVFVMVTTFTLTVLIDLTVAIQAGIILAAFLFIRRMSQSTHAMNVTRSLIDASSMMDHPDDFDHVKHQIPAGVTVFEIYGTLFFGAADKFKDTILALDGVKPKILILRMRHVVSLDATALQSLIEVHSHTQKLGVQVLLSGVCAQPMLVMERSGFLDKIGHDHVFGHIDDAIACAHQLVPTVPSTPETQA